MLNHANSLLRITFQGLFIITRKQGNPATWEIGLPEAEGHTYSIHLRRLLSTGSVVTNLRVFPEVIIAPDPPPELKRHSRDGFNRFTDSGDAEDYRWIMDMEHDTEFHGKKLKKRDAASYKNMIIVNGGELYTQDKTVERYKRFRKSEPPTDFLELGRLASVAGIEIERADTRTVHLLPELITLPQVAGVRYELYFKHMPSTSPPRETHFHHYYHVLRDEVTGSPHLDPRFDVIHADADPTSEPTTRGHHHEHDEGASSSVADNSLLGVEPQVCNPVALDKQENGLPKT